MNMDWIKIILDFANFLVGLAVAIGVWMSGTSIKKKVIEIERKLDETTAAFTEQLADLVTTERLAQTDARSKAVILALVSSLREAAAQSGQTKARLEATAKAIEKALTAEPGGSDADSP